VIWRSYNRNSLVVVAEKLTKQEYDNYARRGVHAGGGVIVGDTYSDRSNAFLDIAFKTKYDIVKPHVISKIGASLLGDAAELDELGGTRIPRGVTKRPCAYLPTAPSLKLENRGHVVDVNVPLQVENTF
jgi:hypothetical protein